MPSWANYLEDKGLVELGIQSLAVDFGLELLLLVRQQVHLDVGIRGAAHVQSGQLLRLDHGHRQTVGIKVVLELQGWPPSVIISGEIIKGLMDNSPPTTHLVLQFAELLFALFTLALVGLLGILRQLLHVWLHLQQMTQGRGEEWWSGAPDRRGTR